MSYKGFTLRRYAGELDTPRFRLSGVGIYDAGGKLRAVAQDMELAKQAVDVHVKDWGDDNGQGIKN